MGTASCHGRSVGVVCVLYVHMYIYWFASNVCCMYPLVVCDKCVHTIHAMMDLLACPLGVMSNGAHLDLPSHGPFPEGAVILPVAVLRVYCIH